MYDMCSMPCPYPVEPPLRAVIRRAPFSISFEKAPYILWWRANAACGGQAARFAKTMQLENIQQKRKLSTTSTRSAALAQVSSPPLVLQRHILMAVDQVENAFNAASQVSVRLKPACFAPCTPPPPNFPGDFFGEMSVFPELKQEGW